MKTSLKTQFLSVTNVCLPTLTVKIQQSDKQNKTLFLLHRFVHSKMF